MTMKFIQYDTARGTILASTMCFVGEPMPLGRGQMEVPVDTDIAVTRVNPATLELEELPLINDGDADA